MANSIAAITTQFRTIWLSDRIAYPVHDYDNLN